MPQSSASQVHVLFPQDGEAWSALARRMRDVKGDVLLVFSGQESDLIAQPDVRKSFLEECKKLHQHLRIATKHPAVAAEARAAGIRVLDRTKHIKAFLQGNPHMNEALRVFSPQLWRQQLKTKLQRMGLLSMPKIRIFFLAGLSVALFGVVIFKLLPSADIYIRPRQEAVSQTVNIFLVQSGSTVDVSDRVRRMPLIPIRVHLQQSLTFDHISKEFIGSSSQLELTVVNKAAEQYALRAGTRFTNQAGMVFKILDHAIVDPGQEVVVRAKADDVDLYGQIIGDRGNVPAGLKWEIPGLAAEERSLVYGENRKAGAGGATAYRTVLRQEDLDLARKRLEQELLTKAKAHVDVQVEKYNAEHPDESIKLLQYAELTETTYENFTMPTQFLGEVVTSVPVDGAINYTMYAYDAQEIFAMLEKELQSHVREGRRLIERNLTKDQLVTHVIDYEDNLRWIKLTVDLTGTEEYILDPLSPTGMLFGKKIREQVSGIARDEAIRIIRNMPEVERVEITQWPPWNHTLPGIPSHISILPF